MKICTLPESCVLWESEDKYGYDTFCLAHPGISDTTFFVVDRGTFDRNYDDKTIDIACSSLKNVTEVPKELYGVPRDDWSNYANFHPCHMGDFEKEMERMEKKTPEELACARREIMDNEKNLVSFSVPKDAVKRTDYHGRFDRDKYRLDFVCEGRLYFMYIGNSCVREKDGRYELTMQRDGIRRVFSSRDFMSGEAKVTRLLDMFADKDKTDGKGGK